MPPASVPGADDYLGTSLSDVHGGEEAYLALSEINPVQGRRRAPAAPNAAAETPAADGGDDMYLALSDVGAPGQSPDSVGPAGDDDEMYLALNDVGPSASSVKSTSLPTSMWLANNAEPGSPTLPRSTAPRPMKGKSRQQSLPRLPVAAGVGGVMPARPPSRPSSATPTPLVGPGRRVSDSVTQLMSSPVQEVGEGDMYADLGDANPPGENRWHSDAFNTASRATPPRPHPKRRESDGGAALNRGGRSSPLPEWPGVSKVLRERSLLEKTRPPLPGGKPALPGEGKPALPGEGKPALPGERKPALPGEGKPPLPGEGKLAISKMGKPALPGEGRKACLAGWRRKACLAGWGKGYEGEACAAWWRPLFILNWQERLSQENGQCYLKGTSHFFNLAAQIAHSCVCVCVCVCVTMKRKCQLDEWQARQGMPVKPQVSSTKHNAKKNATRVRRLFHQLITSILTEEKREAVY